MSYDMINYKDTFSNLNDKIDPFDDFFEYVNGNWLLGTDIPPDKSKWGTFEMVREENKNKVHNILIDGLKDPESEIYPISRLFERLTGLSDKDSVKNIQILRQKLDMIDRIESFCDLGSIIAYLECLQIHSLFTVGADEDAKDSENVKLTIMWSSLCLPDKDYYFDPKLSGFKEKYQEHIGDVFKIVYPGYNNNKIMDVSKKIINVETMIAQCHREIHDKRQYDKLYNKLTIKGFIDLMEDCILCQDVRIEFKDRAKAFWECFFETSKLNDAEELIVYDMRYFKRITMLLFALDMDDIVLYLKYRLILRFGRMNVIELQDKISDFFEKILSGQAEKTKIETRVINYLNGNVGQIIGKVFVEKHFDVNSKVGVQKMIDNIKEEFRKAFVNSAWMCDKTKKNALQKLSTFKTKIGYTDKWDDDSLFLKKLNQMVDTESLVDIEEMIRVYNFKKELLSKIDTETDPHKWSMNPHEMNAYYNPLRNEIVFPAGILQKPMFSKDYPDAINYGAIGSVIAHEISHGYDEQGRKYNHKGIIKNWWSSKSLKKYNEITGQMIKQYDAYVLDINKDSYNVNGKLTIGENMADLGGVTIAMRALMGSQDFKSQDFKSQGFESQDFKSQGFESQDFKSQDSMPLKQFFQAYANVWKVKMKDETLINLIKSDPHSPGKYRTWIVRNIDEFYETYQNISKTRKSRDTEKINNTGKINNASMYLSPSDRIKIW